MGASDKDLWRHATNIIQRSSYGGNGKKQFKLQKDRMTNMSQGGNGGTPSNAIMSDISEHDGSIRQLHFSDWLDGDFRKVLDMIEHWESTEELPIEPPDEVISLSLDELVEQAAQIFGDLDHDARVDALNALAVALEVMDPDDGETE